MEGFLLRVGGTEQKETSISRLEPGARRERDAGWGRRGGARGAGAPPRLRAVYERCDVRCPARTRAVTDAPRAVAARGRATRLRRPDGLRQEGEALPGGGTARGRRRGRRRHRGPASELRDSPPAAAPQDSSTPPARRRRDALRAARAAGSLLPGQRVGPPRAAATPRRA